MSSASSLRVATNFATMEKREETKTLSDDFFTPRKCSFPPFYTKMFYASSCILL